jgi:hypothetical protein
MNGERTRVMEGARQFFVLVSLTPIVNEENEQTPCKEYELA